jgi:hypothetical protein
MTNSLGSVRWLYSLLYSHLVHSAHSGARRDIHDSLFKPIYIPDVSRMIESLVSEEQV